jgi:group II intron reverse transcriptase/maturase
MGLLEAILDRDNLNEACKWVRSNGGAAGVDGVSVYELEEWLKLHVDELVAEILLERYQPLPVRRVLILKPDGGGKRKLGIPAVFDRFVQQAIAQVLVPIFEGTFSDSSYGFRVGRSAHQAVVCTRKFYEEGYHWVVDVDIAKFFNSVNQDILMDMVVVEVKDKRVLRLVRRFLKSGVLEDGLVSPTDEGAPQGGPLSPLLSNVYLSCFDRELEGRGHRFVRYADDCNIFVKGERAGLRVMKSCRLFLGRKLRLQVNVEKSLVGCPLDVKFLGFSFYYSSYKGVVGICVHEWSEHKFKECVREITGWSRGVCFDRVFLELAWFTRGWVNYFGLADMPYKFVGFAGWVRRRLRVYLWKQWKCAAARFDALIRLGVSRDLAWRWVNSCRGCWRVAGSQILSFSLTNKVLAGMGYDDIEVRYRVLCLSR